MSPVGSALADALSGFAAQLKRGRQGGPYETVFHPSRVRDGRTRNPDDGVELIERLENCPKIDSAFAVGALKLFGLLVLFAACVTNGEPAPSAPAPSSPTYKKVTVELRPHNGRPTIFLDGKPTALPSYSPEGWNKPRFMAAVPRFQKDAMGAYFISPVGLVGDPNATRFWSRDQIGSEPHGVTSKGEFDSLDEQAQIILAGDPDACLIVRFNIYEPASWRKLHPGEYFVTDEGKDRCRPVNGLAGILGRGIAFLGRDCSLLRIAAMGGTRHRICQLSPAGR